MTLLSASSTRLPYKLSRESLSFGRNPAPKSTCLFAKSTSRFPIPHLIDAGLPTMLSLPILGACAHNYELTVHVPASAPQALDALL